MHPLLLVLGVLSGQPAAPPPSQITGAVSPLIAGLCRPFGEGQGDGAVLRCSGLVGTDVFLRGDEASREVALGRPDAFLPPPPEGGRLGRSVTWRLLGDRPFAAVLRYRFPDAASSTPDLLVVLKAPSDDEAPCLVGAAQDVAGPTGSGLERAVAFADRRAPLFRCGRDTPALLGGVSDGARAILSAWFGAMRPDDG
ncbi:hypothetical protein [Aureimonas phyllosphaerae]|uniref:Uncharacterized protein n=1 Tax=Aureimonas phyllosphaerae TaxID=1166078 RepID=A0A7W6BXG4_9HYPH|nr:hypothetical protein [Aureimonas phyllosphaerae]MBB3936490.1 hypothetical protein [Aureimonas phyllosphaerae]MBB3960646.1 hypothetical protein [Aureimonas phyllosphaerae]SFF29545.1 hypothetical protein SAMN05216566_10756 [Aureimonas phyllosphaerae]